MVDDMTDQLQKTLQWCITFNANEGYFNSYCDTAYLKFNLQFDTATSFIQSSTFKENILIEISRISSAFHKIVL